LIAWWVVAGFDRLVRHPQEGPGGTCQATHNIGATALPDHRGRFDCVVPPSGFQQPLKQFGDSFIVNILGISDPRAGAGAAAILIAGRSGHHRANRRDAVTEELDAMRVMGIAHGYRLVMPRALALAIVMPLIMDDPAALLAA
jgi:phospholipid/cholesterol/gamma-HCH transport system permease protein